MAVSVRDTGCGIRPEELEEIFVPFFTTKREGRGTGLGLPSVYGAIKSHGGTVQVESRVGEGSAFTLYVPLSESGEAAGAAEGAPSAESHAAAHVLVVDDETGIRDTVTRNLDALGHTAATAEDGEAALTVFAREPDAFDVVLLDLSMPRMTGEDAFRELRRLRPDVPVILMSGMDPEAGIRRALEEGACAMLKKPFTRVDLDRAIRRALGRGTRGSDAEPAAARG